MPVALPLERSGLNWVNGPQAVPDVYSVWLLRQGALPGARPCGEERANGDRGHEHGHAHRCPLASNRHDVLLPPSRTWSMRWSPGVGARTRVSFTVGSRFSRGPERITPFVRRRNGLEVGRLAPRRGITATPIGPISRDASTSPAASTGSATIGSAEQLTRTDVVEPPWRTAPATIRGSATDTGRTTPALSASAAYSRHVSSGLTRGVRAAMCSSG